MNPQGFLHTPLKRARIPIPPHRHKRFYSIFKVYFVLSSWRSNRFRFCPLLKSFVLVAEQSLSLLPSPQKQHLVAFSSAECHIGHKYIIMDKSPCQFKNLSFVFFKYQRSVVSAKAERIG